MSEEWKEERTIARIEKMERYFDAVRLAVETNPASVMKEGRVREMLGELMRYYENGQWMEDYCRDERGELPAQLKRGVLSEDGVYDLLCDAAEIKRTHSTRFDKTGKKCNKTE